MSLRVIFPSVVLQQLLSSHFLSLTSFCLFFFIAAVKAEDELDVDGTVEEDFGKSRDGSRTDDEVVQR